MILLLLLPAAFLVERTTGLWSWGWQAASAESLKDWGRTSYRERGEGGALFYAPAGALTALLAGAVAWGIGAGVLACRRRRP